MNKRDTLFLKTSCLNKAEDNEPVFVLRANDPIAAQAIRHWASMGSNLHNPDKVNEALEVAAEFDLWLTKKNTPQCISDTPASSRLRG